MNRDEFTHSLMLSLERHQIQLDMSVLEQLFLYYTELFSWNERINLISRTEKRHFIDRHLVDVLCALKLPLGKRGRILDVGSGNGLPGIPLAIALPHMEMVLLESREKRCAFLQHACARLKLAHAKVLCGRFEEVHMKLDKCRYILVRGVKVSGQMAALMAGLLVQGGGLVLYQGMHQGVPSAAMDCSKTIEGAQGRKISLIRDVMVFSRRI